MERNKDFVVLSCLGIVFVVASHCSADFFKMNLTPYFDFHVPLFVFIAGYFFHENRGILEFLKRKLCKLIIPYYFTNAVYRLLCWLLASHGFYLPPKNLHYYWWLIDPFFSNTLSDFNSAAWFVMPLMYLETLSLLLLRIPLKNKRLLFAAVATFTFLLGCYAMYVCSFEVWMIDGRRNIFIMVLLRTLTLMPYLYIGKIYKFAESRCNISVDKRFLIMSLLLGIQIVVCLINPDMYGRTPINYKSLRFVNPLLSYLVGTVCILFWLEFSKIVAPVIGKSKIVSAIGANTYSIMTHHLLGFFLINAVYLILRRLRGINYETELSLFLRNPRNALFTSGAWSWIYAGGGYISIVDDSPALRAHKAENHDSKDYSWTCLRNHKNEDVIYAF